MSGRWLRTSCHEAGTWPGGVTSSTTLRALPPMALSGTPGNRTVIWKSVAGRPDTTRTAFPRAMIGANWLHSVLQLAHSPSHSPPSRSAPSEPSSATSHSGWCLGSTTTKHPPAPSLVLAGGTMTRRPIFIPDPHLPPRHPLMPEVVAATSLSRRGYSPDSQASRAVVG